MGYNTNGNNTNGNKVKFKLVFIKIIKKITTEIKIKKTFWNASVYFHCESQNRQIESLQQHILTCTISLHLGLLLKRYFRIHCHIKQ